MNENSLEQTEKGNDFDLSLLKKELVFGSDDPVLKDKQIDSASLNELITDPVIKEYEFSKDWLIIAISRETVDWLSTQPITDEIKQAYRTRKAIGYDPKVNLIDATLYLRDLYGEKLGFKGKNYIDKDDFEKIFANEEARKTLKRIIEKGTSRKNKEFRGEEIEDYIKERYQNQEIQILDVGCSSGIVTERIAKNLPYAKVVGIDLDITIASRNPTKKAEYREADAFALDKNFARNSVDIIISMNLFQHLNIEGKINAVKSFAKVLKNKGLMFIGPLAEGDEDENEGVKVFQKKDNKIFKVDFIESKII